MRRATLCWMGSFRVGLTLTPVPLPRRLWRRPLKCVPLVHSATSPGIPTATHCNTLQHTATHCNALQRTSTHINALQRTATHYNALQHNTTQHNATQRNAKHRNAKQHHATLHTFCYIAWCSNSCSCTHTPELLLLHTHSTVGVRPPAPCPRRLYCTICQINICDVT